MLRGIFESTRITGKNYSFVSTVDLENGMLVHKGELVAGSKDVYEALIPTASTIANEPVYVVGNPAWSYDASSAINQNEDNYVIKAGTVFRVYGMNVTDKFGVADYGIEGTPVIGQYVGLQAGNTKPVASAARPATAFIGRIIQEVDMGAEYFVGQSVNNRTKKIRIEVEKNG
jgi:hypothetical protein